MKTFVIEDMTVALLMTRLERYLRALQRDDPCGAPAFERNMVNQWMTGAILAISHPEGEVATYVECWQSEISRVRVYLHDDDEAEPGGPYAITLRWLQALVAEYSLTTLERAQLEIVRGYGPAARHGIKQRDYAADNGIEPDTLRTWKNVFEARGFDIDWPNRKKRSNDRSQSAHDQAHTTQHGGDHVPKIDSDTD